MLRIRSLVVLGSVAAGSCAFAAPQAMAAASAPRSVVCIAPATGAQGDTGPKGQTGPFGDEGAKGDTGAAGPKGDPGYPVNGAARAVHVSGLAPDCSTLPLLCVVTANGSPGAAGPTGAKGDTGFKGVQGQTGPQGDTGIPIPGAPRRAHPAGRAPCPAGAGCQYYVKGPSGLIGPAGDTGLNGPQGPEGDTGPKGAIGDYFPAGGPARAAHGARVSGEIYQQGDTVTLPECTLPETGGRSTPLLPFGVGLAVFGAAVAWYTRRRKVAPTV